MLTATAHSSYSSFGMASPTSVIDLTVESSEDEPDITYLGTSNFQVKDEDCSDSTEVSLCDETDWSVSSVSDGKSDFECENW